MTHLLNAEDGPWDLFVRLRQLAGDGFWGRLLDCFYCLSVWVAAPAALWLGKDWKEVLFLWLALSGGASLLERLARHGEPPPPARFHEEPENDHGLLRKSESATLGDDAKPPAA